MGWLSWERYMCGTDCTADPDGCISENLYLAQADQLVAGGYRDAGYIYVCVCFCAPPSVHRGSLYQFVLANAEIYFPAA